MATEDKGYIVEIEEKMIAMRTKLEAAQEENIQLKDRIQQFKQRTMALNTLRPLIEDVDALLNITIKEIGKI